MTKSITQYDGVYGIYDSTNNTFTPLTASQYNAIVTGAATLTNLGNLLPSSQIPVSQTPIVNQRAPVSNPAVAPQTPSPSIVTQEAQPPSAPEVSYFQPSNVEPVTPSESIGFNPSLGKQGSVPAVKRQGAVPAVSKRSLNQSLHIKTSPNKLDTLQTTSDSSYFWLVLVAVIAIILIYWFLHAR